MMFYVYKIVNLINGKLYIGVTNNPKKRWHNHQFIAEKGKDYFPKHYQLIHQAINKYGANNFSFEIIKTFDNEDICYLKEVSLINFCKKIGIKLYNVAGGGKGTGSGPSHPMYGKKLPKEWVDKIRLVEKTPQTREKHRQDLLKRNWTGENHPMYGKKHNEETRNKISEKGKGKIVSEETRNRMSKASKGRVASEETRKKMSDRMIKLNIVGARNPNFGNKWSDEQKQALSKKKKGVPNTRDRIFSEIQIFEILILKNMGFPSKFLSEKYKCDKSTVKNIARGITYKEYYDKWKVSFIK